MHKFTTLTALLIALLSLAGCNSPEKQSSEGPTEETTEAAATDPDQAIIERCKDDPTNVWDEDKTLEEQVLGHELYDPNDEPSAGTKYAALQEMRKNPDKDWCGGFTPRGPYDIVPANEMSAAVTKSIHKSETRMQQSATGTNEAGHDVSKIPKTKVDPERGKCLSEYYRSLGPEAGPVSQQVTAEANRRGIAPYEVVGC